MCPYKKFYFTEFDNKLLVLLLIAKVPNKNIKLFRHLSKLWVIMMPEFSPSGTKTGLQILIDRHEWQAIYYSAGKELISNLVIKPIAIVY
ncbi:hypothetical protein NIES4074_47410 [Cylindrospermum sp. NIES-4074]|nr:hypothetical protein NIES4074_47410 [Cylindrospermum sp. NIES-4074]